VPHTFNLPAGETNAAFEVKAIIRDPRGGAATWSGVTVNVIEGSGVVSQPQAIFSIDPNPPVRGQQFTVDARLSFDRPAGDQIATYTWNFGDGTGTETFATASATHTYEAGGTYTISLTVADAESPPNTHTTTQTVTVRGSGGDVPDIEDNTAPTAIFTASPDTGQVGTQFTFDASLSSDPDGADQTQTLTYTWTFGDGETATGEIVTHTYALPGTYVVRLSVRDIYNGSTDATRTLVVSGGPGDNTPPVARIATGRRTGTAPVALTFDGSTSFDVDGDPLSYEWRFTLDGTLYAMASDSVISQTFDTPGTYQVTLTVSDGRGGSSTAGPEFVTIAARGTVNDNDSGQPTPNGNDNDGDGSTPRRFCGLGMVMSLFGSLLGLSAMAASRRRRWWMD
jgi:PKD repeat protein